MTIKITDMQTGEVNLINTDTAPKTSVPKRVMVRAAELYRSAKKLGIQGINQAYYVGYSWTLERGKVWL